MLNIHLHCLVLDGVYRTAEGVPVFHAVRAPTAGELQVLLTRIIKRLMNRMHRCYVGPPALPFSALVNQSKGERR